MECCLLGSIAVDPASVLRLTLHQDHVDASAVHVDNLESPASPYKMIAGLRQFM